ncbi:hypothetical protein REC12_05855 [Desulfosporosinus sp. PR]|uniref:hypothetical protein n=1 Tax=Candidatus Desulfosporosinus nitrosoreducens TaxID=3401928 RepID=UPI0027F9377C|nr:hypothetical protein [Desulfosporosinus sp. PR]MDQ7093107.1 hypothetical protein [Desulfosporosinus sp. PR]
MTERLNNEQIFRRIIETNSDVQRYLDLAPSYKPILREAKPLKETYQNLLLPVKFSRSTLRP